MAKTTQVPEALRYAVFVRDAWACVYCGGAAEDGAILTLDHVRPQATGGTHTAGNLVTCCGDCNSYKRDMSLAGWALYLRERGHSTGAMVRRVKRQLAKAIDLEGGRALAKARRQR
jgi:5-methylcytosine-specific restriction endonuclease McrA